MHGQLPLSNRDGTAAREVVRNGKRRRRLGSSVHAFSFTADAPYGSLILTSLSSLNSLFYGKQLQRLTFPDTKSSQPQRTKEETFAYLLVDVAGQTRDLYDGLDQVFDECEVEIEDSSAMREVSLTQVPPILQIQLQVCSLLPFLIQHTPPLFYLQRAR